MKRFLGFSLAMFFALVAIALVGGDSGAVAGHGCHGGRGCHGGGLLAKLHAGRERCHGGGRERCHGGGLFGKHRRCHGEVAAADCGSCGEVASDCGSCGEVASDCGSCGGGEYGEVVSGGCAGGDCGGEGVIMSEDVPTEAAPVVDEAPAAPPEST
jgi:hypothetical protein